MSDHNSLAQFASLLRERNTIDAELSRLIGRPAYSGHLGEFIAASIFEIKLHQSAVTPTSDGIFNSGTLTGRSVNIKYYARQQGIPDLLTRKERSSFPDDFLVLTGPVQNRATSKGTSLTWCITAVYLFDAEALVCVQRRRGVNLGVASSVPIQHWQEAMIYPEQRNDRLRLTDTQRSNCSTPDRGSPGTPPG